MPKIIIVEDDPMISEIYNKKFSESGFDVNMADSGEQVLSLAKKMKVDLILSDLVMPKMDGFELVKNIRQGRFDPGIKIIIFSNMSQKEERDKAMQLGADGFIVKSDFTPSALVEEVKRQLNQLNEEKVNESKINGNGVTPKAGTKVTKKVLMIEDETIFIEMFGDKLRQDGLEVHSAENGVLGYKEAIRGKYDLFIIDMVLPGMTGDEIVTKLKMEKETKNIPIIIFSASVDDEAKRKAVEMGIDAFFIKTQLIPSDLSKKVTEILENREKENNKVN